jgi:hypothetical protein
MKSVFLFLFALLLMNPQVFAHTRLKAGQVLVPRSTSDSLKTSPCGGLARATTPTTLQAGQTITVNWEETINHPGHFEFRFSPAGEKDWVLLKSIPDDQNDGATTPHQYSTQLTLPSTACTDCTVQLIQVMEENPANPSYYYSCADVVLQSSGGVTGPITAYPRCD